MNPLNQTEINERLIKIESRLEHGAESFAELRGRIKENEQEIKEVRHFTKGLDSQVTQKVQEIIELLKGNLSGQGLVQRTKNLELSVHQIQSSIIKWIFAAGAAGGIFAPVVSQLLEFANFIN